MASNDFTIRTLEDFRKLIKSSFDGTNNVSDEIMEYSVCAFLEQTGLINEAVNILKDMLLCAICYNISLETNLTKCHHIFCEHCLNSCETNSKWYCPMCRTNLKEPAHSPLRLHQIDDIVDAVMLEHNSKYFSWKEQQLLERTWEADSYFSQNLHDEIVEFSRKLETEDGVEEHRQELGNLAQEFSLLARLPCSQADNEYLRKKSLELSKSAVSILSQILQDLPVVDIDYSGSHILNLLGCLRS